MSFLFSFSRKGQGHWTQIVAAILAVVVIIVLIIMFSTNIGQSQKTITQCTGIPGVSELKGTCQQKLSDSDPCGGRTLIATATCPNNQVCCVG